MDKPKPSDIIAARYQISRESAKCFLIRVQKSFQTEKPPHQLILNFMEEQAFESLPKPHHIATLMNEAGLWVSPLRAAPPASVDEEDLYVE